MIGLIKLFGAQLSINLFKKSLWYKLILKIAIFIAAGKEKNKNKLSQRDVN